MTIILNGQAVELGEGSTPVLLSWLESRGLKIDRVAVERNGEIVPRSTWHQVELVSGDRLEVVHFVGGGHP